MSRYLVDVIERATHVITVCANDEHEALILAQQQIGEFGESSAPELVYRKPRLLVEDE